MSGINPFAESSAERTSQYIRQLQADIDRMQADIRRLQAEANLRPSEQRSEQTSVIDQFVADVLSTMRLHKKQAEQNMTIADRKAGYDYAYFELEQVLSAKQREFREKRRFEL